MAKLGIGYESIHACKYDYALFWVEHVLRENYLVCGKSHCVDKDTKGEKIPNKILRYFPLTPRFKQLYGSRHTTKHI